MAKKVIKHDKKQRLDRKYNSRIISKLISIVMIQGKKSIAEDIVYGAFNIVEEVTGKKATDVFATALKNATPALEVRSRRIGAVNYQIPLEIKPDRAMVLGIKNIVYSARNNKKSVKLPAKLVNIDKRKYSMRNILANEIIDAANNTGRAVKKKEEMHKIAEANKANARYRW
ncbi:MAG: 30S ribosomal protein S7 [Bacilli bacterium]|nr:30S ribosomal protein S7 [Bacilli bacterium]